MSKIILLVDSFFNNLEIYEDKNNGTNYKEAIVQSIHEFITEKTTESAQKVYKSFFEAYWIGIQYAENPFIYLVNEMNHFEKNAGRLLNKQRDHYIHSVNVFILGLVIFNSNLKFRQSFKKIVLDDSKYKDCYTTSNEEFFYRWGISSLSHDIAYPLQITLAQSKKYIDLLSTYAEPKEGMTLNVTLNIFNFNKFNKLQKIKPCPEKKLNFIRNILI